MRVSWVFGPVVIVAVYCKENSAVCQALFRGLGWISMFLFMVQIICEVLNRKLMNSKQCVYNVFFTSCNLVQI